MPKPTRHILDLRSPLYSSSFEDEEFKRPSSTFILQTPVDDEPKKAKPLHKMIEKATSLGILAISAPAPISPAPIQLASRPSFTESSLEDAKVQTEDLLARVDERRGSAAQPGPPDINIRELYENVVSVDPGQIEVHLEQDSDRGQDQ